MDLFARQAVYLVHERIDLPINDGCLALQSSSLVAGSGVPDLCVKTEHLARERDQTSGLNRGEAWNGQASELCKRSLAEIVLCGYTTDREIQKQAVFALSQHRDDDAVPLLIRIARAHRDPEIRKTAMFWLGQTEDARAVAFFEEILTGH